MTIGVRFDDLRVQWGNYLCFANKIMTPIISNY